MNKIKNFERWLGEGLELTKLTTGVDKRVMEIYMDTVVYYCLGAFSADGGNNTDYSQSFFLELVASHPELFGDNGPDLWVNCGDFGGKIREELSVVAKEYHSGTIFKWHMDKLFEKYGMAVQALRKDEVIMELRAPYHGKTQNPQFLRMNAEAVVKFYTETQPQGLKELGEKLRTHFNAKDYGL